MKSYWHLSYLTTDGHGKTSLGFFVLECDKGYFDFADFYSKYPSFTILDIAEINEEQYMALGNFILSRNGEDKGNESES